MGSIIVIAVITIVVALLWTRGITKMHDEHPEYDGADFLNEEPEEADRKD